MVGASIDAAYEKVNTEFRQSIEEVKSAQVEAAAAQSRLATRVAKMDRLEKTLRRLKSKIVVKIDHELKALEEEGSGEESDEMEEVVHPSDLDGVFDGVDFTPEFLASLGLSGAAGGTAGSIP